MHVEEVPPPKLAVNVRATTWLALVANVVLKGASNGKPSGRMTLPVVQGSVKVLSLEVMLLAVPLLVVAVVGGTEPFATSSKFRTLASGQTT